MLKRTKEPYLSFQISWEINILKKKFQDLETIIQKMVQNEISMFILKHLHLLLVLEDLKLQSPYLQDQVDISRLVNCNR